MNLQGKKCLIAYFSRKGNNYSRGSIVNLPIGNTEVIAKMVKDLASGDLFRIDTIKPYPEDYGETTEVAGQELRSNERPALLNHVVDMGAYQVVFLGYPNWWGTMPMAVRTFLEEYDFSGKTIVPFCTHEGSGLGSSIRDIAKLCPRAELVNAIGFHGTNVKNARKEVESWIQKLQK
ncbi:MAG TPA: flavodoxin [Candidatus Bathyarchaeia archaeon]